jgi:hypothetical protein
VASGAPQLEDHPLPTTLTESDIQEATRAWEAVTAPEPDALLAFLAADESHSLPFLSRALSALGDTNQLRGTEARLTEHGEAILAGDGNAVEWNGIDDWVGGVHLDSRSGRVWFHRDGALIRSRA